MARVGRGGVQGELVREGWDYIGVRPLILPATVNEELGRGKVEGLPFIFPLPLFQFFPPPSSSQFFLPIP